MAAAGVVESVGADVGNVRMSEEVADLGVRWLTATLVRGLYA
jgi:hypothetical protein